MQGDHASSTDSAPQAAALLSILLPLPLAGPYDYRADIDLRLERGDFVIVPLGSREVIGVVWGEGSGDVGTGKLRDVVARLDAPRLPDVLCRFVDWVAHYTMAPPGAVLSMAMRAPAALEPPRGIAAWRRSDDAALLAGLRLTAERRRVLDVLADGPPRPTTELAREAGVGVGVVKALADAGALVAVELPPRPAFEAPDPERAGPTLSAAQSAAAAALSGKVAAAAFAVTALDGVTGAGKTEVYFEAIARALRDGRQALVLLPEIALGAQWLDRFTARFGVAPAQWHSDLTAAERRVAWRAVALGQARVVVGARSALFLPFPDLGLIVVDEEHDPAYKQEDGVAYHARDMAVVRGNLSGFPVVLSSATPSVETRVNADRGRYTHMRLPARYGVAFAPEVAAIDLKTHPPERGRWISPPLVAAVTRRSLSAAIAAIASPVRTARPGWSSTASEKSWSATIAATRRSGRKAV